MIVSKVEDLEFWENAIEQHELEMRQKIQEAWLKLNGLYAIDADFIDGYFFSWLYRRRER